jgi:hypothetical protein
MNLKFWLCQLFGFLFFWICVGFWGALLLLTLVNIVGIIVVEIERYGRKPPGVS